MGLTSLKVKISNPQNPKKGDSVDFMVDSGAIYSVVDKEILKKLGIKPHGEKEFFLANGQKVTRKIGGALYEYEKEKGYSQVIFGEKGDSNLLGVTTLESLGFVLDPFQRKLLQLPMILGGLKNK
ncbi:aspartyl protease family protein [Candidatus Woesebacteria bacterium]|nr:aspartyl protease family protein [Candidatus Woesebacteria bacterium]